MKQDLIERLERVSQIATSAQRKVVYLVVLGFSASGYLAWLAYNPDSTAWWNAIKCGLLMVPALVWCFVWNVLGGLQQTPTLISSLASQEEGVVSNVQSLSLQKKEGLRSLFDTLRAFRNQEGLEVVMNTIGGLALLANPVFVAFTFLCMAILLLFMVIAPVALLFL